MYKRVPGRAPYFKENFRNTHPDIFPGSGLKRRIASVLSALSSVKRQIRFREDPAVYLHQWLLP